MRPNFVRKHAAKAAKIQSKNNFVVSYKNASFSSDIIRPDASNISTGFMLFCDIDPVSRQNAVTLPILSGITTSINKSSIIIQ